MTGSEIFQIHYPLDVALHVADLLELDVGAKKCASDLVEALIQNLLVDDGCIAHMLYGSRYSPS